MSSVEHDESIAYIIIFLFCWVLAAGAFHAIKWMILNWPDDDPPSIIKWFQGWLTYYSDVQEMKEASSVRCWALHHASVVQW